MMKATLVKHGEDHLLIFSDEMMELLGITADTSLDITVEGGCLIIIPVRGGRDSNRKNGNG